MTRFLNAERCTMIADALAILSPDTPTGYEIRDQLERIMRVQAAKGGAIISDPEVK